MGGRRRGSGRVEVVGGRGRLAPRAPGCCEPRSAPARAQSFPAGRWEAGYFTRARFRCKAVETRPRRPAARSARALPPSGVACTRALRVACGRAPGLATRKPCDANREPKRTVSLSTCASRRDLHAAHSESSRVLRLGHGTRMVSPSRCRVGRLRVVRAMPTRRPAEPAGVCPAFTKGGTCLYAVFQACLRPSPHAARPPLAGSGSNQQQSPLGMAAVQRPRWPRSWQLAPTAGRQPDGIIYLPSAASAAKARPGAAHCRRIGQARRGSCAGICAPWQAMTTMLMWLAQRKRADSNASA